MAVERRTVLSSYLNRLLSAGRVVFSKEEAQKALGVSPGAFLDAAERQQRKHHLISPRRGFYVIVPPQYLTWGAPPPQWYIDELMQHEGRPYYVGLLKAAELHGATHQAVMEFQIVTDKRLPEIRVGRSAITFYYRKDIAAVSKGIEDRKTDTGHMKVSSLELTVFDLVRYPHASGGLDNVATVISDLAGHIDATKLANLSSAYERPVIQRLGYLLDRFGHRERAEALHSTTAKTSVLPWIELERSQAADPEFSPAPQERDERWRVIVRRGPERDE
ncbi:MAG: type IV toxin-antitoxin system AbiEi family antitoxin [Steroidobacteraceae bacterium]